MQYHTLWVSNSCLLLFLFTSVYAQNQYENSQKTNSAPTPLIWEIILNPHKIHLFLVMLVTLNKYVKLSSVKEGIKSSKITPTVTEIVGAMFIIHLQIMKSTHKNDYSEVEKFTLYSINHNKMYNCP